METKLPEVGSTWLACDGSGNTVAVLSAADDVIRYRWTHHGFESSRTPRGFFEVFRPTAKPAIDPNDPRTWPTGARCRTASWKDATLVAASRCGNHVMVKVGPGRGLPARIGMGIDWDRPIPADEPDLWLGIARTCALLDPAPASEPPKPAPKSSGVSATSIHVDEVDPYRDWEKACGHFPGTGVAELPPYRFTGRRYTRTHAPAVAVRCDGGHDDDS